MSGFPSWSCRVAQNRARHAAGTAPATAELGACDGDDFDALVAKAGVGVDVSLVRDHDPGGHGQDVVAVVPLFAGGLVAVTAGLDQPQPIDFQRLGQRGEQIRNGGDRKRARRPAPASTRGGFGGVPDRR